MRRWQYTDTHGRLQATLTGGDGRWTLTRRDAPTVRWTDLDTLGALTEADDVLEQTGARTLDREEAPLPV